MAFTDFKSWEAAAKWYRQAYDQLKIDFAGQCSANHELADNATQRRHENLRLRGRLNDIREIIAREGS